MSGTTDNSGQAGRERRVFGRLGWRILFWMALIGLGPLLVMAVQGYHCARMAVIERAEAQLNSVVLDRKVRIEQWLGEREDDLRGMAMLMERRDGAAGPCEWLEVLGPESRGFGSFAIYDRQWRLVCGEPPAGALTDRFRGLLESGRGLVSGEARYSRADGLTALAGVPLDGLERAAWLVAGLDLAGAVDRVLADTSGLGVSGKTYMYFSYPDFLYTPADSMKVSRNISPLLGVHLHTGTSATIEYVDFMGERVLGISRAIPELRAAVIVDMESGELFGWLDVLRKRALVTGLLTLALVLVVAFRSSMRLSAPLRRLASTARRIASGSHGERIGAMEGHEAREVGEAFNRMLDELEAYRRRLVHSASLAAVGELSSSIVHEMRNPLASVRINLQALARAAEGSPAHNELAGIALGQVDRLERMLSELLDYSRPLELRTTTFDVSGLAAEALEDTRGRLGAAGRAVSMESLPQGLTVRGDREQLRRVLVNLIDNACRAVDESRGRVELAAAEPETGMVGITVSDNGPGVEPERRERVFRPFHTTREGGTGLGLANVKKIVEAHGGEVRVEGSPAGGALFCLTLPAGD